MDEGRRLGVATLELAVCRIRIGVVHLRPALPCARPRRRRKPQVGKRRPQVEARPAGDDSYASVPHELVDRRMRQALVLADRHLVR
jgi:hypothetical protein